jgi:hypothetical protein
MSEGDSYGETNSTTLQQVVKDREIDLANDGMMQAIAELTFEHNNDIRGNPRSVEAKMQVIEQEGVYKSSRIAGPKHNYLGIAFSRVRSSIEIIARELPRDSHAKKVVADEVLDVVVQVVKRESEVRGQQIYVTRIEFVPTDTPEIAAYEELATIIARYVLQKLDRVNC